MRRFFARVIPLLLLLSFDRAPAEQNSAVASPSAAAAVDPVHISFAGRFGEKPFACGESYEGVGSKGDTVTPADLRFFVSDVMLLGADGTAVPVTLEQDGLWQYKSLALIDLEDGTGGCRNGNTAMHAEVSGTIPKGVYVGLRFTLGVPFELDHIDDTTAPSPLNMTAMLWSWQNGYKFLRAEVSNVAPRSMPSASKRKVTGSSGFPVHVGSTGCVSTGPHTSPDTECKNPNRPVVSLPVFDREKDAVILDVSKLLAQTDLSGNSRHTAPGCMSFEGDADCVGVMKALGISYGGVPAEPQVVFYARAK
jgi:uncharacterized repeat protein (TIGR04052 family)